MPFFTSAASCSNSFPKIQTPNFLPRIFLNVVDAARLEGHLGRTAPGVDLCDVDEIVAGVPVREQARQPVDPELRAASEHDLLGDDVRAARLDVHVEARPACRSPSPWRRSSRRTAPGRPTCSGASPSSACCSTRLRWRSSSRRRSRRETATPASARYHVRFLIRPPSFTPSFRALTDANSTRIVRRAQSRHRRRCP